MLFTKKFSAETLKKSKKRFYWVGGIMFVIGTLSLAMPLLASFAVETFCGFLLLAVAAGNAFGAWSAVRGGGGPWQQAFMAVISFAASVIFLTHPLAGIMTLSLMLSAYFVLDGIAKIAEYVRLRPINGSLWILVSGILSVVLAVMMWRNFFTGASMIGIILGINFVFSGVSLIVLGRGCSEAAKKL